jgi:protein-S-isoprenylcysteine O-methyltransferase Ste14
VNLRQEQKAPAAWHWLGTLSAAALVVMQFFLPRGENGPVRAVGIGSLALSVLFMFPPFVLLKRYGRPRQGQPYFCTTTVVDRGVFAIVRHPQYLGYVLLVLGFAALSQHPVAAVLALLSACSFYLQALREESFCKRQLGESYGAYMRRVPRFNFLAGLFRYLTSKIRRA